MKPRITVLTIGIGYFRFAAQYLQLVLGLSALLAGLWSLPSSVGFVVGSNVAPRFVHRFPPAIMLGPSLMLAAIALAMLTQVGGAIGLSIVVTAPPERAGAASGISEIGAELGGALGIAEQAESTNSRIETISSLRWQG